MLSMDRLTDSCVVRRLDEKGMEGMYSLPIFPYTKRGNSAWLGAGMLKDYFFLLPSHVWLPRMEPAFSFRESRHYT
jgi:hypothetical protein